jgi:tetratricopeptide (TPR) repeat protein
VASEDEHGTRSVDERPTQEHPTQVRARRAAVLAGVGVVWAAFLVAIGLILFAGLVFVAAFIGVVWVLGVRLPHADVPAFAASTRAAAAAVAGRTWHASRRSAARARSTALAAGLSAKTPSRRLFTSVREAGRWMLRQLARASGAAAERATWTTSAARRALRTQGAVFARPRKRRSDPRVDEALASNSQGIALARAGRHAEAIDAFDTALALLAETGDRHHEGQVLANLGTVHRKVGGTEAARFCWSKALERLEPGTPESERTAELLGVR